MNLPLTAIRIDGGTQPRMQLDAVTITEYAESMIGGIAFPPVVVFYDGTVYWLADGFHRLSAAGQAGRSDIEADVRQGSLHDAQWYSYSVNQSHGLRRSNDDKRRAVEAALVHSYASKYSDNQIAQHCGVSQPFVSKLRSSYNDYKIESTRLVTRNGSTYEMNVAKIGASSAPDPIPNSLPAPLYACVYCTERFASIVWHCPLCDHHSADETLACAECGHTRNRKMSPGATLVETAAPDSRVLTYEPAPLPFLPTAADYADPYGNEEPELWQETVAPESRVVGYEPSKADALKRQQIAVITGSSESNEWYTPAPILNLAREVLGDIDLDPASSEIANQTVQATHYFSVANDGYAQPWHGRVWLNPPYGKEENETETNATRWSKKLIAEYEVGRVSAALLLVKAALGYNWFEDLWEQFPTCLLRKRLSFVTPTGDDSGQSKHATAILYLGEDTEQFQRVFRAVGRVVLPEDNSQ